MTDEQIQQVFSRLRDIASQIDSTCSDNDISMRCTLLERMAGDIRHIVSEYSILFHIY